MWMIRKKPGAFPAAAVAAMILLVGSALIRLGTEKRIIEAQASADQTSRTAAYSLEQKLRALSAKVELFRAKMGNGSGAAGFKILGTSDQSKPIDEDTLVFLSRERVRKGNPLPRDTAACRDLEIRDWVPSEGTSAEWPELLDPVRVATGEWRFVLREPAFSTNPSGEQNVAGWVAACVPLDGLLRASNLDRLQASGLDYQLVFRGADHRQSRIVSSSAGPDLKNPIQQVIHSTQDKWLLLVAPHEGWMAWPLVIFQAMLVAILALSGAVYVYDVARRPEQLRAEIDARDKRLRNVNRKLGEEIQQREEIEKKLSHASFHDAATGLPNRNYFMERLSRALQRTRLRAGYMLAVMVLSFDRLKNINESLGPAVGDELLLQAVNRLGQCLRPEDLVLARLEGDEFAVLLFDIGSVEAAAAAGKRLQNALVEPFKINGQNIFTTASLGIALSSSGYETAGELVSGAHLALSKAKSDGRAQCTVYDPGTREETVTRHQLETDLHQAIERQEFFLNFQPIVSLKTGEIAGMEVLLRWRHPLEGVIAPGKFIPLAEETGLIVPITRWVLREACAQARSWRQQLGQHVNFYLSVNLSVRDLQEADVCDYIARVLAESGLPAGMLRLEITENMMMGNINAVSELVGRFREMGVPLLLDDFGTGYSSLSYLNRFHFDYIKIDQAFVRRLAAGSQNAGIVRAIIHLAKGLRSKNIAEGVETSESAALLKNLGCEYGQGHYFSKPLESEQAQELLLSKPVWGTSTGLRPGGPQTPQKKSGVTLVVRRQFFEPFGLIEF